MENQNEKNLTLPHESPSATAEPSDMENENMMNKKNLTLPPEVIVEILLRLPVRSLRRFKKVSPSWSSIISDPQFKKSHFDLNAAPTDRLLLRFLDEDRDIVQSFDLASSLDDRSAIKTLNVPPPSMLCNHNPLYFLGSCRGFMLLAYEHTGDLIVWNPTTGFDQQILDIDHEFVFKFLCGFGYDSSTDDYFVVVITLYRSFIPETEMHCFSLKNESCCDVKYGNVHYMDYGHDSTSGVFLNDSLHWLVIYMETRLPVVIGFDLGEKSLSEIPLSSELAGELARKVYYLRVLGGCLSLCSSGGGGTRDSCEIWVMKNYKVQASWTKAFVITSCHIPCRHFYPVCFTEGGGVVGTDGSGTLMKFSSKGKLLEHRKYDREYKKVTKYFEMYRESLLLFPGEERPILCATSLPGDFKEATKEEKEKATSLPGDFKEATKEEEKAIEDEEASGDEYASGDEEEEATEDSNSSEGDYPTEDEEEEATEDSNASEGDYPTEDEEDATEEEEEGETDDDDDDDDSDSDDYDSDDNIMMEKMKMTYSKKK
ncbi:F-box/kelch-repeat protein At3g23880-like isoform X2 [Lotus japonicus]|uniref:F-box/kelch-repeat protein At3g23880-like isoform X1 n=1 Tax=Lotus japonicus TaxID=34305 RepID=UPI0025906AD6|nr:F-box/kelch-repeat protein At3g23880-like isoform X1 [Lotus japonicus]XP_057455340.1 F-box/kelch-repeat protein At3g23880-like isoform X2 [Lotus japonicus]